MSNSPSPPPIDPHEWRTIPNYLSAARLILSFGVFAVIDWGGLWMTALFLFVVTAITDALDGYLARKWNQITIWGRILDPLVDKVLICGCFIFLQSVPESGVCGWVTSTVVIREFLVTALRGHLEGQGVDFSAKWSGKLKMILQCVVIPVILFKLDEFGANIAYADQVVEGLLALMVGVTAYSGAEYLWRAIQLVRQQSSSSSADA